MGFNSFLMIIILIVLLNPGKQCSIEFSKSKPQVENHE